MQNLTPSSYYSHSNTAISNSKVNDFLKGKEYYKSKHIDKTFEYANTPAMLIGSMVDDALSTGSITTITKKYEVKVAKKEDPEKYKKQKENPRYVASEDDIETSKKIAKRILKSDFYKFYKENATMFQVQLQGKYDGIDVCGMADAITVLEDRVYLDDFKTTAPMHMTSPAKWYWHCKDAGLLRQLAHYKNLIKNTFADRPIICRHIVISSDPDLFKMKIFQFDEGCFEGMLDEFKDVMHQIVNEKEWVDKLPAHSDYQVIYPPYASRD